MKGAVEIQPWFEKYDFLLSSSTFTSTILINNFNNEGSVDVKKKR